MKFGSDPFRLNPNPYNRPDISKLLDLGFSVVQNYEKFVLNSYKLFNKIFVTIYNELKDENVQNQIEKIMIISNEALSQTADSPERVQKDTAALKLSLELFTNLSERITKVLRDNGELNKIAKEIPIVMMTDLLDFSAYTITNSRIDTMISRFTPVSIMMTPLEMEILAGTEFIHVDKDEVPVALKQIIEIRAINTTAPSVMGVIEVTGHSIDSKMTDLLAPKVISSLLAIYQGQKSMLDNVLEIIANEKRFFGDITGETLNVEVANRFNINKMIKKLDMQINAIKTMTGNLGSLLGALPISETEPYELKKELFEKVKKAVPSGDELTIKTNANISVLEYVVVDYGEVVIRKLPIDSILFMRIAQTMSTASDETDIAGSGLVMTFLPSVPNGLPLVLDVLQTLRGEETDEIRRKLVEIIKRWTKNDDRKRYLNKEDVLEYLTMFYSAAMIRPLITTGLFNTFKEKGMGTTTGLELFKAMTKQMKEATSFPDPLIPIKKNVAGPNMYI